MSGVPYTFGTATTSIPLSNLDSNFVTPVTIGNASVALGNTISTIGNLTLNNVTINGGTINASVTESYSLPNAVVYSNSSNVGVTSANLGFNGTTLTANTLNLSNALGIAYGGTGLTTLTAGYIPYGNGTSAFNSSGNLTFDGSNLTATGNVTNANVGANGSGFYGLAGSAFRFTLTRQDAISAASLYINAYGGIGFATGLGSGGTAGAAPGVFIDTSGSFYVGATSSIPAGGLAYLPSAATGSPRLELGHLTGTASGGSYINFAYNSTTIGSVTQNGTTGVLYNLTSDYRLKNNPIPLTGALEFIMALQPKTWDWWDGSGKGVGFIAHEFMEIAKYSGSGEKDAVDENGKPAYQAIQPSSSEVMANLVALMQEQQALIESLTTRLTALESK